MSADEEINNSADQQIEYLASMYEDISLRLEVISEIMDEMLEAYPNKPLGDLEKRIQQKLFLRKLSTDQGN